MPEAYISHAGYVCCSNDRCRQRFARLLIASSFDGEKRIFASSGWVMVLPGWRADDHGIFVMTRKRRWAVDRTKSWARRRQPDFNSLTRDEAGVVTGFALDPAHLSDGPLARLPVTFRCKCGRESTVTSETVHVWQSRLDCTDATR